MTSHTSLRNPNQTSAPMSIELYSKRERKQGEGVQGRREIVMNVQHARNAARQDDGSTGRKHSEEELLVIQIIH